MKVKIKDELYYIQWRHQNNGGHIMRKMSYGDRQTMSYTECIITNAETKEVIATAKAILGKNERNFCKETGRRYSLKRLLSELNLSKSERKEIWETYFFDTNQTNTN